MSPEAILLTEKDTPHCEICLIFYLIQEVLSTLTSTSKQRTLMM